MGATVALGVPAWAVLAVPLAVAALIDLRERRLPNALSAILVLTAIALCYGYHGWIGLGVFGFLALATCTALASFEIIWRTVRGESGLGMGDVKALFALMLLSPEGGILVFAVALLFLAVFGLVLGRRSLPMLPFMLGSWVCLGVMGGLLP